MSHRATLLLLLAIFFVSACAVSEKNIAGTYSLNTASKTRLVLNKDGSFEFVKNFSEPGPAFFPDSTEMNFRTSGNWELNSNHELVLNSSSPKQALQNRYKKDSVIHHTSITSLSFWDSYGDPVQIRFIKFLPDKIKFYRGNTISFFREDFNKTDTLEFHFYGYRPIKWPSMEAENYTDNHTRWFTLYEEDRRGYFNNLTLSAKRKKLASADKSFTLYKN